MEEYRKEQDDLLAFEMALECGNADKIRSMLKVTPKLRNTKIKKDHVLVFCVKNDEMDCLRALLEGSHIRYRENGFEKSALYYAVKYEKVDCVRTLLDGMREEYKHMKYGFERKTILHMAVTKNNNELIRAVLDGCPSELQVAEDLLGCTPLYLACKSGKFNAIDELLQNPTKDALWKGLYCHDAYSHFEGSIFDIMKPDFFLNDSMKKLILTFAQICGWNSLDLEGLSKEKSISIRLQLWPDQCSKLIYLFHDRHSTTSCELWGYDSAVRETMQWLNHEDKLLFKQSETLDHH
eukprot:TRINITY_DN59564_c0_g1_i1.p1 TRINITY_DN59564_c0_g1~~TRINITY_DN59564_c0_g1_i1.p1  ORF type:complete len:294 (+),score=35.32 TRINITY_DN59564_c0_g1_i1:159-1040(+)